MIILKNTSIAYSDKILVKNANIQLYRGQKVGLVGKNGSGKTSLFKLLLKQLEAQSGELALQKDMLIGYVEQEIVDSDTNLIDYILQQHPLIMEEQIALPEYYQLRPAAEKLLTGLGFKLSELEYPLHTFSGGWQMRANLAKALFLPSDLLLLDEPSNHLDLETVIWLENWLKRYNGLTIIISHDREFLDSVTTHVLSLSNKELLLYTGNYSTFEITKAAQVSQQASVNKQSAAKMEHLQKFIDKFSAGTRAKQAQSRAKMLDKIKITQQISDPEYELTFLPIDSRINRLVTMNNAEIGYTDKILVSKIKLDIFYSSRIAVLGPNGVGKSTLIKCIIDQSTLLSGKCEVSHKIKIGYFAQHTIDNLDLELTPLGFLQSQHQIKEKDIRSFLGKYGFSGDAVYKKIVNFSGGEKARLVMANMILKAPHLIIMDEPTNHLDMQMRQALALGLQMFEGAVIIISHDKFLLESVADEFYLINEQNLTKFNGTLKEYEKFLLTGILPVEKLNMKH